MSSATREIEVDAEDVLALIGVAARTIDYVTSSLDEVDSELVGELVERITYLSEVYSELSYESAEEDDNGDQE
jgi:hypothetical protein